MQKIPIEKLVGGEKLAKEITTSNGLVLIPEQVVLKKEYIQKMKELNIDSVYIEEQPKVLEHDVVIEEKIQSDCKNKVRETIEKYSYCANSELDGIVGVADQIIQDILSEPEVMYNVSCVREKSESAYSHSINVSALAVLIGLKFKLSDTRIKELAVGALLHDLGIVYLPFTYDSVIFDKCDEAKKKTIMKHVITGYSMVEHESWLSNVSKDIILSHHERCDGSGYPMHLKNKHIRIETSIVAVCDEFDSRVYGNFRKREKVHNVIDYIVSEAGRKFNFQVVQRFIESVAVYPIGTVVKTNLGISGIVVKQNYKMPTRPVIQVVNDTNEEPTYIDLTKDLTTFIIDTLDE